MPFNGSGGFIRHPNGANSWQDDATAGTKIRADLHDNHDQDIANGLGNTICRDGQSTISADISWSNHKITNLGAPGAPTDAANKAYADGIRNFNTSINLTMGGSTFEGVVFTSTGYLGMKWTHSTIDMAFGARPVDEPSVGKKPRLVINDKANGTGTDIFEVRDDGTVLMKGPIMSPLDSTQPIGTVVEKHYAASATWTRPDGLKGLEAWVIGGGGAGGGAPATAAGVCIACGGGGGAGWTYKVFTAAEIAAMGSSPVTIGQGGAANATGTGGTGGGSSFGGVSAGGGAGGTRTSAGSGPVGASGGAGGAGSGGSMNGASSDGGQGIAYWNDTTSFNQIGGGGITPWGSSAPTALVSSASGAAGIGYGAGGRGAANSPSQPARAGGAGADGFVLIIERF